MSIWGVFRGFANEKYVCQVIKTPEEGKGHWAIEGVAARIGWDKLLHIRINRVGGWCGFEENADFVRYIESDAEPVLNFRDAWSKNDPGFSTGWVSPDCDTYRCDIYDHTKLATDICDEFYGGNSFVEDGRIQLVSDEKLFKNGWIRVSNKAFYGQPNLITGKQLEFLKGIRCFPCDALTWTFECADED